MLGFSATAALGATSETATPSPRQGSPAGSPALAPMLTLGQAHGSPSYSIYDIHVDHLGSTRIVTDINGYVISEHEYFLFGEAMPPVYIDTTTKRFTGHERDEETGLDYCSRGTTTMILPGSWR